VVFIFSSSPIPKSAKIYYCIDVIPCKVFLRKKKKFKMQKYSLQHSETKATVAKQEEVLLCPSASEMKFRPAPKP